MTIEKKHRQRQRCKILQMGGKPSEKSKVVFSAPSCSPFGLQRDVSLNGPTRCSRLIHRTQHLQPRSEVLCYVQSRITMQSLVQRVQRFTRIAKHSLGAGNLHESFCASSRAGS